MTPQELAERMKTNPDRGTPCRSCGTAAKDCQASYVLGDGKCCDTCTTIGGAIAHKGAR